MTEEPAQETGTKALVRRREAAPRRRISLVGIVGELFITAGMLVLLFLGWQLWLNDIIVGGEQREEAQALSEEWDQGEEGTPPPRTTDPGEPVVASAPDNAVAFANLIVPRFGADYMRTIAEGVGVRDVLNKIGFGHYPTTQMPGEVGNFAIAAHRKAYGGGLEHIHELQVGDSIFIETADGWYRYVFRSLEYVLPTGVGVLDQVPQLPGVVPSDRIVTLTSCNPFFSTAERIIAYGVYDRWYPRADGPPDEIAPIVQAGAG